MRNKKSILWLAAGVCIVLGMLLLICWLSIVKASDSERGREWFMAMGGVELRNTITLSSEQVEALDLDYSSQNVYFYASDSDDILICEYLRSNREEAKASVSLNGGRAMIMGGAHRNYGMFWINIGGWERIEVYLPDKLFQSVNVSVSSGNLTVQENFALHCRKLFLKTSSGNIRSDGAIWSEETQIQVSSGNITLKEIEGVVSVEASSGNISFDRMSGSGNIETKSGNIRVMAEDITGDLSLEASSGNIKLKLPKGLQFHFAANTSSGIIKTDFNDSLTFNQKGNQAEGNVGQNPTVQIDMRAKSGNVRAVY